MAAESTTTTDLLNADWKNRLVQTKVLTDFILLCGIWLRISAVSEMAAKVTTVFFFFLPLNITVQH